MSILKWFTFGYLIPFIGFKTQTRECCTSELCSGTWVLRYFCIEWLGSGLILWGRLNCEDRSPF